MNLYLGVTDTDWFAYLRDLNPSPEDINFWQPGGSQGFNVLPVGGPFLFKLKAPINAIGGVGFFSSHTKLPLSIAWETFGIHNGCATFEDFRRKIQNYRRKSGDATINPEIGCIVLTDPVFFRDEDFIELPSDWKPNIVQGKRYFTEDRIGKQLWSKVHYTLMGKYRWHQREEERKSPLVVREYDEPQFRDILTRVRVGQGTFRVQITDTYRRRCAISGEKTLPVLEAAHIKPYSQSGPHAIPNGLLLRSDLHKLFDSGYVTVTSDYRVEVSGRIKEEFENGKEYYRYHGSGLWLPPEKNRQPDTGFLTWHNERVYNG